MSHYLDKTRLLVAKREGEDWPMIVGAYPQSTWEIISPEDWDKWKRETIEAFFGPDWTAYDLIEVVMEFPATDLAAMFEAREIKPVRVSGEDTENA